MRPVLSYPTLMWVALASATASAAPITLTTDRVETTVNDPILLTIKVESSDDAKPRLPEVKGFTVQPHGQSSEVRVINGAMTSSVSYNYLLQPKSPGSYTLGPATVVSNGREYDSNTIKVRVVAAGTPTSTSEPAFITASVSNTRPYVGEQIVYTFRFWRRVQVNGARADLPDFTGFSTQALGDQNETGMVRNGESYRVTELKRALVATQPGKLEIPEATLTVELRAPNQPRTPFGHDSRFDDPFGEFFGRARTVSRTLRSEAIALQARALPTPPARYSGAVGKYNLSATLSRREIKVGDSTTLEVVVTGEGNAATLVEPTIVLPSSIKIYDDKPEEKSAVAGDTATARKVFRKALVPREAGDIVLPDVEYTYFDPKLEAFATARAALGSIHVAAAAESATLAPVGPVTAIVPKQSVEVVGNDILPIRTQAQLVTNEHPWFATLLFGCGATLPPAAFFVATLMIRRRERFAKNPTLARRRTAQRRMHAALAKSRALDKAGQRLEAWRHLERAVKVFAGDLLHTPGLPLTATELSAGLVARGCDPKLAAELQSEIVTIEAITYGAPTRQIASIAEGTLHLQRLVKTFDKSV